VGRIALVFPGQGTQSQGMGRDVAERFGVARRVFQEANEVLGFDIERLCFEGPQEKLDMTDYCQPAIFTTSIATLRAVEEVKGPVEELGVVGCAGLSIGEYAALVAAGVMEFADALKVVHLRGRYMQEACEARRGAMYSILGLDDDTVEEVCAQVQEAGEGVVSPANYNCPGQLVISGDEAAAEKAAALLLERGARRAVRLKVAGAFHSELMLPAAEKLSAVLEQTSFGKPRFPVVFNVTGRSCATVPQMRSLLARQVASPVRWAEGVRWLVGQGAECFYEVGPGRVLCGLLKRIEPSVRCTSVGGVKGIEALAGEC